MKFHIKWAKIVPNVCRWKRVKFQSNPHNFLSFVVLLLSELSEISNSPCKNPTSDKNSVGRDDIAFIHQGFKAASHKCSDGVLSVFGEDIILFSLQSVLSTKPRRSKQNSLISLNSFIFLSQNVELSVRDLQIWQSASQSSMAIHFSRNFNPEKDAIFVDINTNTCCF